MGLKDENTGQSGPGPDRPRLNRPEQAQPNEQDWSERDWPDLFRPGIPGPGDGERWASVVRAAADGELPEDRTAALGEKDPALDQRLAFERGLASAVARVMGPVTAPQGLRERVLAVAREAEAIDDDEDLIGAGLSAAAVTTRERSFWNSSGRLFGALAAVLVLAVSAMFVARLSPGPLGGEDASAYRTALVQFVTSEHRRTLDDEYAAQKALYTRVEDAVERIGGELDHTPAIPSCGGRTHFRGASPCGVPGKGPSAHFQFTVDTNDRERKISLFVRRDLGELPIEAGRAYRVNTRACKVEGVSVYIWRSEGLLYTIVTAGGNGSVCCDLLSDLGIREPDPDESI